MYQLCPAFDPDKRAHLAWTPQKDVDQISSLSTAPAASLLDALQRAAASPAGIIFYDSSGSPGASEIYGRRCTYQALLDQARTDSVWLQSTVPDLRRDTVVLLHFDSHAENIFWFWAVTVAGYLPCILPKLAVQTDQRVAQAQHILHLLNGPVILTNDRMACAFAGVDPPRLYRVDQHLHSCGPLSSSPSSSSPFIRNQRDDDLGALMLTSGSTGFSKAVCLRQPQMLAAAAGKAAHCGATPGDVFLSWIALDHVVNLVEMHLQALLLKAEQVHIATDEVLAEPRRFLDLVDRHRVSLSFAPNFFLSRLCERVCHPPDGDPTPEPPTWDLSCLRCVFSGGEPTVRQMALELTQALQPYGAQPFIRAGYGLTESCAGMAWDLSDGSVEDIQTGSGEFLSCGRPIPGALMRIVRDDSENPEEVDVNESGMLQLTGPIIFNRYYRDPEATAAAFTSDGWFITGDMACQDEHGRLFITGRVKDTLLVNGLTISSVEVEHSLEQASIPGLTRSYTIVFPYRPTGAHTESYCVVYLPSFAPDDAAARAHTTDAIERIASLVVHVKPAAVLPLPLPRFDKTSLGKLSRAHFRRAFETGLFDEDRSFHEAQLQAYRKAHRHGPSSATEHTVLALVCAHLAADPAQVSTTSNLFHLGLSSLDFYALTQQLQHTLQTRFTVPDLLADPTVAGVARRVDSAPSHTSPSPSPSYDPVVPLQRNGNRPPLWLVHPASGNVLIFTALARAFHDRPIYAFRSRGVQRGEALFPSASSMAATYHAAMKRTQPTGPYALAGYSLGSSIAFEIAKRLESNGDEVRFLGALDGPPDIGALVGNLTWTEALVMLAYFYELIPESLSRVLQPQLATVAPDTAMDVILQHADATRRAVLQLDRDELAHVTNVTAGFSRIARDYHPAGKVSKMDIFVVDPLSSITDSKREWVDRYLGEWKGLVSGDVVFHYCEGKHAEMLGEKYVNGVQRMLRRVLEERGL
ncbi:hypothetical protein EYZ11_008392 [Aspergillus tanneri]|uniref:Carrier domain-containing protein n=1 Tax=Aspergillus tanneri TaxID=1220188 RepID=A0A4S3JCR5_9EURO|nr:hypothetical protein EYZ11_008392 [Aspergillus tanneri]